MADNLTTLTLLTLAQTHRGDIVRQINRSVQFLKMVPITTGDGGKNCAWAVEKDGALAENYTEGADAINFGGDTQLQAILPWALYRANPHVTQLAMDAAATSYDPEGNKALWGRTLVNHASELTQKLNSECFVGAGTGTTICGLVPAIATDNNTYANIDRTVGSNAFWKPTVIAPGADTAPTFADMRDDVKKIYESCGSNPDLAVCSPTLFNYIGGLFDDTRRRVESVTTARGEVKLDFGFQALELDGMVIVKDRHAGQGTADKTIFYINTNVVELAVLPTSQQRMLEKLGGFGVQANDGFGPVPMSFHYEMLAKTGASEKAEILSTCQLMVRRPNACGARKNAVPA